MASSVQYSSLPPYRDITGGGSSGAISGFRWHPQSLFTTRRPWRELLSHPSSYSIPYALGEAAFRIKFNLAHFRVNYTMIALLILFLSLLYHPISMIVFLAVFALWLLLYLSRDEPITLCSRTVNDRAVSIVLGILTVASLILTGVWLNVLVALLIAGLIVVLHSAFRVTEDLFLDEDELSSGGGVLPSVIGSRF